MIKRILFQGDSITDFGRSREEQNPNVGLGTGYPLLVADRLLADYPAQGLEFFNRGISGNRVVDLYARWKIDALNLKPDLLSILIGVNDTWHEAFWQNGVEVPRYAEFYRRLLEWSRRKNPELKLILISPFVLTVEPGPVGPTWRPEIDQRREIVANLASEFDAAYIDAQQLFDEAAKKAPNQHWLSDGVHPAGAGHQLLADAWVAAARRWL